MASLTRPPLAASAAPFTSHEAAERHAKSGKVKRNQKIAMALVRAAPGSTGYELWSCANEQQRADLVDVVTWHPVCQP